MGRIKVKLKQADINNVDDAQTSANSQRFGCLVSSSCIQRSWRDHIKASLAIDLC